MQVEEKEDINIYLQSDKDLYEKPINATASNHSSTQKIKKSQSEKDLYN